MHRDLTAPATFFCSSNNTTPEYPPPSLSHTAAVVLVLDKPECQACSARACASTWDSYNTFGTSTPACLRPFHLSNAPALFISHNLPNFRSSPNTTRSRNRVSTDAHLSHTQDTTHHTPHHLKRLNLGCLQTRLLARSVRTVHKYSLFCCNPRAPVVTFFAAISGCLGSQGINNTPVANPVVCSSFPQPTPLPLPPPPTCAANTA